MRHPIKTGQVLCYFCIMLGLLFVLKGQWELRAVTTGGEPSQGREAKVIALTFDDGPHPVYTPELLKGLEERNVEATFFVTGENASLYPELIERMQEDGHLVANHTYHHVELSSVGQDIFIQELKETNRVLEGILEEEILYVRPPFGQWNKEIENKINMFPVLWDIDPKDWCSSNSERIAKKVLKEARDGAIILLHDEYAASIEAALEIVDSLQKEGYEFVTVDEILFQ